MAGAGLTDQEIDEAKQRKNPYRLFDGHGLPLAVTQAVGRFWRRDGLAGPEPLKQDARADRRSRCASAQEELWQGMEASELGHGQMENRKASIAAEPVFVCVQGQRRLVMKR